MTKLRNNYLHSLKGICCISSLSESHCITVLQKIWSWGKWHSDAFPGGGRGCTQQDKWNPNPVQDIKDVNLLPCLRESAVISFPIHDWTKQAVFKTLKTVYKFAYYIKCVLFMLISSLFCNIFVPLCMPVHFQSHLPFHAANATCNSLSDYKDVVGCVLFKCIMLPAYHVMTAYMNVSICSTFRNQVEKKHIHSQHLIS